MTLPLEKILTTSARDYVETVGRKLYDYRLIGVHCLIDHADHVDLSRYEPFVSKVPDTAEVVVNFRASIGATSYGDTRMTYVNMSGTALIPKR